MSKNVSIAQMGDPVLRKPTEDVSVDKIGDKKIQSIIEDLIYTMRKSGGAGLAANQIYYSYSICVIEINNNERYQHIPKIPLTILVNPKINVLDKKNTFSSYEGCLSVPNIRGRVDRYCQIYLQARDRYGEKISKKISG